MFFHNCSLCGSFFSGSNGLCASCLELINSQRLENFLYLCPVCSYPRLNKVYECPMCAKGFDLEIRTLFSYENSIASSMLSHYKFDGCKSLAPVLARFYRQELQKEQKPFLCVPVPCSRQSLKKRGWDQMSYMCRFLKEPYLNLLVNVSDFTEEQKNLTKEQRRESAMKKYALNKISENIPSNIRIILLDDIVTTGSTLFACKTVLLQAGFTNIKALTLLCDL